MRFKGLGTKAPEGIYVSHISGNSKLFCRNQILKIRFFRVGVPVKYAECGGPVIGAKRGVGSPLQRKTVIFKDILINREIKFRGYDHS